MLDKIFDLVNKLDKQLVAKNGKCPKCNSKDRRHNEYTRAYNDLCQQAAGESGYYCMNCRYIEFKTPDFEKWLNRQPRWIVRQKGDKWREAAPE